MMLFICLLLSARCVTTFNEFQSIDNSEYNFLAARIVTSKYKTETDIETFLYHQNTKYKRALYSSQKPFQLISDTSWRFRSWETSLSVSRSAGSPNILFRMIATALKLELFLRILQNNFGRIICCKTRFLYGHTWINNNRSLFVYKLQNDYVNCRHESF